MYRILAIASNLAVLILLGWAMSAIGATSEVQFAILPLVIGGLLAAAGPAIGGALSGGTGGAGDQIAPFFDPRADPVVAASSLDALLQLGLVGIPGFNPLERATPLNQAINDIRFSQNPIKNKRAAVMALRRAAAKAKAEESLQTQGNGVAAETAGNGVVTGG